MQSHQNENVDQSNQDWKSKTETDYPIFYEFITAHKGTNIDYERHYHEFKNEIKFKTNLYIQCDFLLGGISKNTFNSLKKHLSGKIKKINSLKDSDNYHAISFNLNEILILKECLNKIKFEDFEMSKILQKINNFISETDSKFIFFKENERIFKDLKFNFYQINEKYLKYFFHLIFPKTNSDYKSSLFILQMIHWINPKKLMAQAYDVPEHFRKSKSNIRYFPHLEDSLMSSIYFHRPVNEILKLLPTAPGSKRGAMYYALRAGHFELFLHLLKHFPANFKFNQEDDQGSMLKIAAKYGHLLITKHLIENQKGNPYDRSLLNDLFDHGHFTLIKYFIDTIILDITKTPDDEPQKKIKKDYLILIKRLAYQHHYADIIKYLIKQIKYIDPIIDENFINQGLHSALIEEKYDLARFFIKKGASLYCIDPKSQKPLVEHLIDDNMSNDGNYLLFEWIFSYSDFRSLCEISDIHDRLKDMLALSNDIDVILTKKINPITELKDKLQALNQSSLFQKIEIKMLDFIADLQLKIISIYEDKLASDLKEIQANSSSSSSSSGIFAFSSNRCAELKDLMFACKILSKMIKPYVRQSMYCPALSYSDLDQDQINLLNKLSSSPISELYFKNISNQNPEKSKNLTPKLL